MSNFKIQILPRFYDNLFSPVSRHGFDPIFGQATQLKSNYLEFFIIISYNTLHALRRLCANQPSQPGHGGLARCAIQEKQRDFPMTKHTKDNPS